MTNGTVDNNILDRVKKMLNMTVENGCTEEEAATAMSMAQAYLFKYDLEMADVVNFTPEQRDANEIVGKGEGRLRFNDDYSNAGEWVTQLAFTVGQWSFCKVLSTRGGAIFIGRKVDIAVTKEMFTWIRDQCEHISEEAKVKHMANKKLWRELNKKAKSETITDKQKQKFEELTPDWASGHWWPENAKTWKYNFLSGMIVRLDYRLCENWRKLRDADEKSTALVLSTGTAIDEYVKQTWPKLGNHKGVLRQRGEGFDEGHQAAGKVAFTRPVGLENRKQLY